MRASIATVLAAVVASLVVFVIAAPSYLPSRGFPLDDAWIHAVYARAFARSGTFAYNPGLAATGATSPLWVVLCALPHLVSSSPGAAVLGTKLLGLVIHCCAAVMFIAALSDGGRRSRLSVVVGAALVGFHPALVSAAVSGMEVPLALLGAAALLYATRRCRSLSHAAIAALAVLARPELALLALGWPVLLFLRRDRRRFVSTVVAALIGVVVAFGTVAMRNLAVSGWPLPASFYAKVGTEHFSLWQSEWMGFAGLFGHIPVTDSSMLLTVLLAIALRIAWAEREREEQAAAAAAFLGGVGYCVVSFVLVPPRDPDAFYYQRYVLPAVALLVAGTPLLIDAAIVRWSAGPHRLFVNAALCGLIGISMAVDAPARYAHLANDAQNIDDVQVKIGRVLARTSPADVVWATDAGAIRYFGNAFVVDLMGLNTPAVLGPDVQEFLGEHRPRYIEMVPGWVRVDQDSAPRLQLHAFPTSTRYTVTGYGEMGTQWLADCPPNVRGRLFVRQRQFDFACEH